MDVAETQLKEASLCRTNRALKKRQTVDPRSSRTTTFNGCYATQTDSLSASAPAGFVLISRTRLLAAKGISQQGALLIDQWVGRAGGGLQPLVRANAKVARKHHQSTTRPDPIVWGVPAQALKQAGA